MTGLRLLLAFTMLSVSVAFMSPGKIFRADVKCLAERDAEISHGRREFFGSLGLVGTVLLTSNPALAASQEEVDKANIVKGYKRLQYLLDNWEKETTICKVGSETTFGDQCQRNPAKVMEYLGYRSISDPLFKADKTLKRLAPLIPSDNEVEFLEAVERYMENAEEANGMAYISSWGESNPGGGKDRVELFIERAKNNIIASKETLATVIKFLDLKL